MNPTKKIYIATALFLLIYVLLIIFLLFSTFRDIKEYSQKLQLTKKRFNSLIAQEKKEGTINKLYENYQPVLENIEKIFINSDLPLDLINFLEETASSSKIQLTISSMTKGSVEKDPWPSLFLKISISGLFQNSLQFLEKLENGPYLIEVLSLTVQKSSEREMELKEGIIFNLFIKVFTR